MRDNKKLPSSRSSGKELGTFLSLALKGRLLGVNNVSALLALTHQCQQDPKVSITPPSSTPDDGVNDDIE